MNIQLFEKDISKVISSRGKNYYKSNSIHELQQIAANAWRASVIGTDDYFVYVELNNDTITESVCTCPFNGTCKHEVAVYYAIREQLSEMKEQHFDSFFEDKSREQLIEMLTQLLRDNPTLMQQLTPQQSKTPDVLTAAQVEKRILQKLNPYLRMGYIGESSADKAFSGVYGVLEEIEELCLKNPPEALQLICQCIETTWQVETYCEEWVYEQLMDDLLIAFDSCILEIETKEMAKQVTDFLLAKFKLYTKYQEDNVFLLEAATDLCPLADSKDELLVFLDGFSKYDQNADLLEQFKLKIVDKVGTDEEIQAFYERKNLSDILRNSIIATAIKRQDYDVALSLCADGIENPQTPAIYKKQWLSEAFNVHGILKNPVAQRSIAFELAVSGRTEEYKQLKALYEQDEEVWQELIDDLLLIWEEREQQPYHYPHILEEEQRWEKLLHYCQYQKQHILRFGQALQPHYPQEVEALHIALILGQAEKARDREQYRALASIIQRMRDLSYNERADEIKNHLISQYPRKKAMHEELNFYIPF